MLRHHTFMRDDGCKFVVLVHMKMLRTRLIARYPFEYTYIVFNPLDSASRSKITKTVALSATYAFSVIENNVVRDERLSLIERSEDS